MPKEKFYIDLVFFILFFVACSEENPSIDFSENNSSSDIEDNSSSSSISSSSEDAYSSNVESSSSSWAPYSYGELVDERDGQTYKTIKIGEQTWMAENLNFDYHNPFAPTPALAAPSYCYDNSQDNCKRYGRLYRWSIAMDSAAVYSNSGKGCGIWSIQNESPCKNELYSFSRGTCPENWHIPTESEVKNFVNYANASPENAQWVAHYWFYGSENDAFAQKKLDSIFYYFLTSIEIDSSKATLLFTSNNDFRTVDGIKSDAFFVRCVKDTLPILNIKHGELVDERDGQVYKTIKIGEQTWMAENLNYAYLKPSEDQDSSSWCYNNEPDSCAKYGRLYTWDAAMDVDDFKNYPHWSQDQRKAGYEFSAGGVCPQNWHLPSMKEWSNFTNVLFDNAIDIMLFDKNYQIGKTPCFWTPMEKVYELNQANNDSGCHDCATTFCFSSAYKEVAYDYLSYFDYDEKNIPYPVRCVKGPPTYED